MQKPSQPQAEYLHGSHQALDQELKVWKQGNLETLDMLGAGDYLGIKYDGPTSLEEPC